MTEQRPSITSCIYNWLYGNNREYVPLRQEHQPRSECWHEEQSCSHTQHISEKNHKIEHLGALGNYLSDKILWLFEVLGKLSRSQKEIASEIKLKIDLIENTLTKLDEQIPVNFGEAFVALYETTQETKEIQEKLLTELTNLSAEIQKFPQKILAIERATGAALNNS